MQSLCCSSLSCGKIPSHNLMSAWLHGTCCNIMDLETTASSRFWLKEAGGHSGKDINTDNDHIKPFAGGVYMEMQDENSTNRKQTGKSWSLIML